MKSLAAEYLGTFMMVFAGTGAIVVNQVSAGAIGHLGIAGTFGLVVLTVIYAFGDLSGAHINPAVTFGFWLAKRFPGRRLLPYVAAQSAGALSASLLLAFMFPDNADLGATVPAGDVRQSFVLEIILTWWLMLVILFVSEGAKEKGLVAGIVIGSVVALEACFGGPISGASMNPARSLGPALLSSHGNVLWLYCLAPAAGSAAAVLTHRLIAPKTISEPVSLPEG